MAEGHIQVTHRCHDSSDAQPVTQGLALAEQRRWDSSWLKIDAAQRSAQVSGMPDESSVPFPIDLQLVIELYALNA